MSSPLWRFFSAITRCQGLPATFRLKEYPGELDSSSPGVEGKPPRAMAAKPQSGKSAL